MLAKHQDTSERKAATADGFEILQWCILAFQLFLGLSACVGVMRTSGQGLAESRTTSEVALFPVFAFGTLLSLAAIVVTVIGAIVGRTRGIRGRFYVVSCAAILQPGFNIVFVGLSGRVHR